MRWQPLLTLMLMSGLVTPIVLGLEALGGLELLELQVFDWVMQSRPPDPPDDRLLVVGITEEDLDRYKFPLSDAILAQLLQRLQQAGAKVIGVDLYRNLPQPPGTSALSAQWQEKNVVGILQLGYEMGEWVAPPSALSADQIGFNDVPLDQDSVVRRGLLFGTDKDRVYQSFAFRLARQFLEDQGIKPQTLSDPPEGIAWGATTLIPLLDQSGGYARLDDRGYQILLDYRSGDTPALVVTVQAVLEGQVPRDLIHDRIVLIGSRASSLKDQFFTPYTPGDLNSSGVFGVLIHAQITQHLLDLAQGSRSCFHFLPPGLEKLWVGLWVVLGVVMMRYHHHHPLLSGAGSGLSVLVLWGLQYSLLRIHFWVPLISPTLGLCLGIATGLGYSRYRLWELHQSLLHYSQEQAAAIDELRALSLPAFNPQINPQINSPINPPINHPIDPQTFNPQTFNPQTFNPQTFNPQTFNPQASHQTVNQPLNQRTANLDSTREQYLPTALPEGERLDFNGDLNNTLNLPLENDRTIEDALTLDEINDRTQPDAIRTPAFPPGGTLGGRYHIQSILGEGGFGITYRAEDSQRPGNPVCVIKRLFPARKDPRFLQAAQRLFRSEAQILETLGRNHDRIPQLLAYFEEDQEFFLVQDLVEGHPLSEELRDRVPFTPSGVLDLLLDILPTLAFIHRHQLIHRDLKPSNLIRRTDGALVVIDFGAVKHFSEMNEAKTLALGTPGYMAPEQQAGHPRLNSDLYAIGMIAIECLIAKLPAELPLNPETGDIFWQSVVQEHHGNAPELRDLMTLLSRLVEYNTCDRYQSSEEALNDCKKLRKSWSTGMVT